MNNPDNHFTTLNKHGLSFLVYKGSVCMTVYEDSKYQIFYTEETNSVFDKKALKVFDLTIESWTKLAMKIESVLK